ncbi:MAG: hypothetical protein L6435_11115 [Anaerolineae bacterium]|nr:hypothetical protein [Anaerolineae bacterium]
MIYGEVLGKAAGQENAPFFGPGARPNSGRGPEEAVLAQASSAADIALELFCSIQEVARRDDAAASNRAQNQGGVIACGQTVNGLQHVVNSHSEHKESIRLLDSEPTRLCFQAWH